ncbi:hypothetical protein IWX49DRAFT_249955 [Phyllosticta citricarpa]
MLTSRLNHLSICLPLFSTSFKLHRSLCIFSLVLLPSAFTSENLNRDQELSLGYFRATIIFLFVHHIVCAGTCLEELNNAEHTRPTSAPKPLRNPDTTEASWLND